MVEVLVVEWAMKLLTLEEGAWLASEWVGLVLVVQDVLASSLIWEGAAFVDPRQQHPVT